MISHSSNQSRCYLSFRSRVSSLGLAVASAPDALAARIRSADAAISTGLPFATDLAASCRIYDFAVASVQNLGPKVYRRSAFRGRLTGCRLG